MAGATPADVDVWAIARGRRVHLRRKAWFALTHRPGAALFAQHRIAAGRNRHVPDAIATTFGPPLPDVESRTQYIEHHPAHLASAFYTSGMPEAACCAIDGFGDFVSVSVAHGRGTAMDVVDRTYFPHSLGLLDLAITQHLGFKKFGDDVQGDGAGALRHSGDIPSQSSRWSRSNPAGGSPSTSTTSVIGPARSRRRSIRASRTCPTSIPIV